MKAYVETNFILELAFLREEHPACQALLALAKAGEISLLVPAFSIGETYEAWVRRAKRREELNSRLAQEVAELSRSEPYRGRGQEFQKIRGLLSRSSEEEKSRLDDTLGNLFEVAELISIEPKMVRVVRDLQAGLKLSPQDLMIYASVLTHLEEHGSGGLHCFLTKNTRDFLYSEVREGLASWNCRVFPSFADGLGFLRSRL